MTAAPPDDPSEKPTITSTPSPGTSGPIRIDSPEDPRVAAYMNVPDRDLIGTPGRPGRFIGEQDLIVRRMLEIPGLTESVLVADNKLARLAPHVPRGVPLYVADRDVMAAIVGFPIHRGVLAVGRRGPARDHALEALRRHVPSEGPCTVMILEDITHVDNVGQLFRVAAAMAVDGVILSPRCHDPLYRKALRMSIGHALRVPWARSEDWPGDLDRLRAGWGLTVVGASLDGGPLDGSPRPRRVGLLVGTERHGLSAGALERCDALVRIPIAPQVDSLNVAVAAAVCLHRLSRGHRR